MTKELFGKVTIYCAGCGKAVTIKATEAQNFICAVHGIPMVVLGMN